MREEEDAVRKLAAIFGADVAGYRRLMGQDEIGTLRRLTACRPILDERIAAYRGRIFGSAGDSVVADFASAVDAVQCAVAVQHALATEEQIRVRIGVHVGDVIVQGGRLFGDGVTGHKVELSWWETPAIALHPCPVRAPVSHSLAPMCWPEN
jgi:adenylate cyclase